MLMLSAMVADAPIKGNPENWCRAGFFTRDTTDFNIGVVKRYPKNRPQRTNFHRDDSDACAGGAGRAQKAFVVAGDELVVNRIYKGYACSWYAPAKGASAVGWIKRGGLGVL
ncbi:MAG: hypothetical protein H0V76_00085 [Blastocatellia bacterium]|nr:hypothetical protein [Blastocatellia bacterium]